MATPIWLSALLAGAAAAAWLVVTIRREGIAAGENRAALEKATREAIVAAEKFERALDPDWPVRWQTKGIWHRWYLMMSADQARIRLVSLKIQPYVEVREDRTVDIRSVVSVEVQQSSTTVQRFESKSATKRPSALGRAAAGGLLLGGAGAIVGAISAPSVTATSTTGTSEILRGPVYLVVGTTDLHNPVLKVQLPSMSTAEAWLHRIRGAIAVNHE